MKWHKKLLIIVLLISFIVGLGSFGIHPVSAAAPANPPTPLTPQGEISLCDTLLRNASFKWTAVAGATGYTIYVKQRGRTIELWIGRNKAQITEADGRQYLVAIENGDGSIVPFIYNGRTYLPLRFISEQLNATVTWDEIQKIATIEFPIVP
jgi:hypothetical protein